MDIDRLSFRQLIAVAEAALFEPMLHGSWSSVDELLNHFEDKLMEAMPSAQTWGASREAQASNAAAEDAFGPAIPLEPPEASTIAE